MKDAVEVLKQIAREKFWGSVQFDFRDGEVTLIRKTETINGLPGRVSLQRGMASRLTEQSSVPYL